MLLGAAGLVLVLDLVSGAQASTAGILWALGAMVGAAVYFVLSSDEDNGLPPHRAGRRRARPGRRSRCSSPAPSASSR